MTEQSAQYLEDASAERDWVVSTVGPSGYRTDVSAREHRFTVDEPTSVGGSNAGPTPYEYLLGSLGGCTAMTLRMYANRKQWPLERVEIKLRTARSYARDCENCVDQDVGITRLERRIELTGPLTVDQRARLLQIADRCPVKQSLERGFRVETTAGQ